MKNHLKTLLGLGSLALALCAATALRAQSAPAIFVTLSTAQVASGTTPTAATTTTIAAPGTGWAYSAAAPVAGTTWNVIQRPNPLIPTGTGDTSRLGLKVCNSANNIALTSATGTAAVAYLTTSIDVISLDSNAGRTEPSTGAGGNTVLGPNGLMDGAWRIYNGAEMILHSISGLTPGQRYYLYCYGSTTGAGGGARFTLNAANVPGGNGTTTTFVETRGAVGGNVFVLNGSNYAPNTPAAVNVASTATDTTTWGQLDSVVDATGTISFRTSKNPTGVDYSNGFQLMPYPLPVITLQPMPSTSATIGGNVTFTIAATGDGTLTYQWRKNGTPITNGASGSGSTYSGATTTSLTIGGLSASDDGSYDVVVTNPGGSTTSSATAFTSTSGATAPSIVANPVAVNAITGGSSSFSVSANGTAPLTYQWQKSLNNVSFTDVSGAISPTLNLSALTTADAGYYRVVVTNSVSSATSASATLTIAPVIVTAPSTAIVAPAAGYTITVAASAGTGSPQPITYVWQRDGVTVSNGGVVSGATTGSLVVSSFGAAQSGYYTVTASNTAGSVTSAPVYVGVASTQGVTFAPGNNATGIAIDQQLRFVFPSPPKLGISGALKIYDASNDSVVATIDVAQFLTYAPGNANATIPNAAIRSVQGASYYYMPIAIYGNEAWVTLSPTQRLAYGKTYYVTMDTAVLLDSTNAAYTGVSGSTTWRFSTKSAGPATPTTSTGPTTITIAQDGAGDFATFQGAFDWIPQNNTLARTIQVQPGVYRDNATLAQNRNFVTIVGTGASRTDAQLIYPFAYFAPPNSIFTAGSLRIESSDVTVRNLTLDNIIYLEYRPTGLTTSGSAAFAGAINTLATTGNRIVCDNVLIKGGQDTIYNIQGIIYYYNCEVWGSVDFIYGKALAVFDKCTIVEIRSSGGPITAPNTLYAQPYGLVFLNCMFPRALIADGYPYDVSAATTQFQRPWGNDGSTSVINCKIGTQITTKGWSEWDGRENTCRAREYGNTLIAGGAAPTAAQRQAAGAYWVNTIDPDYTTSTISPTDPLLVSPTGSANRIAVTVNPADYTLAAIFGHSYFALNGWLPTVTADVAPSIVTDPLPRTVAIGQSATFSVVAAGTPPLTYQWRNGTTPISGAISSSYTIASAQLTDIGSYNCVVTNDVGNATSASATLAVLTPFAVWANSYGLDASAPGFASADADGDGVANLLEYVFGGNPTVANVGLLPTVTVTEDVTGKHLVLEYKRATAATSVTTTVETSTDLATWTTRTFGVDADLQIISSFGQGYNVDVNTLIGNNYTGLAVAPGGGTTWNSFISGGTNTLANIADSTGAATPTSVAITSSGGFSQWSNTAAGTGTPTPTLLMQDYLFGNTYTVTMSNLPQGTYQLYVYAHGDVDNQTSTLTLGASNGGGTKFTTTSGGNTFRDTTATGAEGIAYVKFAPTVSAAGTLQFSVGPYLNGFQLVQVIDPETVRITIPFTGDRLMARLRATSP
jgi:pectin methylesterase-like acyl-CoA thioesterase